MQAVFFSLRDSLSLTELHKQSLPTMGRMRGFIPVALAVGFGVLNGYVTFAPSFLSLEADKKHDKAHGTESATPSQPSQPLQPSQPKPVVDNVAAMPEDKNSTAKTVSESPKQ
ncbi:hypothetical protein BDFG_00493 [Blastomyces dermatitidis ATCC 26199]|nr:hypothetical protein BDFG_00493 [Blastomyces dermatitidis ATCC 26199]